ncbi:hypothetical protein MMPV_001908 [Pyropia vietnamensis]
MAFVVAQAGRLAAAAPPRAALAAATHRSAAATAAASWRPRVATADAPPAAATVVPADTSPLSLPVAAAPAAAHADVTAATAAAATATATAATSAAPMLAGVALALVLAAVNPPAALAALGNGVDAGGEAWRPVANALAGPGLFIFNTAMVFRIAASWYPAENLRKFPLLLVAVPTEPLLRATRRVFPPVGGVDISPIVWFAVGSFVREILVGSQGLLTL